MSSESGKNVEETSGGQSNEISEIHKRMDAMMSAITAIASQMQQNQQSGPPPPPPVDQPESSAQKNNPPPVQPPPIVQNTDIPPLNPQGPPPIVQQGPPPVVYPPYELEVIPEEGVHTTAQPIVDETWVKKIDSFVKQIQGKDKYGAIDYDDFCLFPDVQIPSKFKMPDFTKYNGSGDPVAHMRMFCNLLGNPTNDPRLAMRMFLIVWRAMLCPGT